MDALYETTQYARFHGDQFIYIKQEIENVLDVKSKEF